MTVAVFQGGFQIRFFSKMQRYRCLLFKIPGFFTCYRYQYRYSKGPNGIHFGKLPPFGTGTGYYKTRNSSFLRNVSKNCLLYSTGTFKKNLHMFPS